MFLQKSAKYSSLNQQRPHRQYFAFSGPIRPTNISAAPSASFFLSSSTPGPAPVPPTAMTSSQPLAVSAYLVRNPEVKSSSSSSRENQSLLDSPPSYKKVPDSVPDDVKTLLQKFPSILRTGDVKQTPNHGVEHHIHTGSQPPCFCKIPPPRSREIANHQSGIQKVRICWHYSQIKITMGFSFAHGTLKRWIVAALWRLPLFKFGDNPRQVSFTKHARPYQLSTRLHNFFKN